MLSCLEDLLLFPHRSYFSPDAPDTVSNEPTIAVTDLLMPCLTHCVAARAGGTLLAAAVIGAAVLMNGSQENDTYPGVLALLADVAGHPKEVITAQITMIMSAVLQQ